MNGPIPLALFTNTTARGGTEEHILTLLRGLDSARFRMHLVCPQVLATQLAADLPSWVELLPLSLASIHDWAAAGALFRYFRSRSIAIVHSHMFYSSFFASPVAWAAGVPVILETPHVRETWRTGWLKSRYFVDRMAGRLISHYVAVSEANSQYLKHTKRLPAWKITVIRNGVDVARLASAADCYAGHAAESRKALGFDPSDPVLVVAARLEPQKGHRVLLEALPAVRASYPNVRVLFLGDGSLRGHLEQSIYALRLEGTVRLMGYQSEIAKWMAIASFSILPSFYEGLPLAAIESLSAGKAVVATSVDGTPEIVVDGQTGLTVPPGDSKSLAGAICRLLADPALARVMGKAGRERVFQLFDQSRQIETTADLYLRLWELSRRRRNPLTPRRLAARGLRPHHEIGEVNGRLR